MIIFANLMCCFESKTPSNWKKCSILLTLICALRKGKNIKNKGFGMFLRRF